MQTVERAFAVLSAVATSGESAGVSQVARQTGLAKSTVSRLLSSLEELGMVERLDDNGGFVVGPAVAALAGSTVAVRTVRELSRPYLHDLATSTGESAGLTVPDGRSALYVEHVAGAGSVQTRDWTGMRFPLHTVAGGLALMMTWSDDQLRAYASHGLESFTDESITTERALLERVADARRSGCAWTIGEFDDDINGVAAPVRDGNGTAIAAVTVYGPSFRFPGQADATGIGEAVAAAAGAVEGLVEPT